MKRVFLPVFSFACALAALTAGAADAPQPVAPPTKPPATGYRTWEYYGGDAGAAKYSALNQINRSNVKELKVAWTYRNSVLRPFPAGRGGRSGPPVGGAAEIGGEGGPAVAGSRSGSAIVSNELQVNPIIVNGVMYVRAQNNEIVALDAATGKEIWARRLTGNPALRGLMYWASKDGSDRRIFIAISGGGGGGAGGGRRGAGPGAGAAPGVNIPAPASGAPVAAATPGAPAPVTPSAPAATPPVGRGGAGGGAAGGGFGGGTSSLVAINAANGEIITSFGTNGEAPLIVDFGQTRSAAANTPGIVFEDLVIMGSTPGENEGAAPGHIRAFDVRTGALKWVFHTIPHPGEFGYDTWPPDAYKTVGAANNWGGMSVDEKRGLVFVPTGSPVYDFYGANRKGMNLFSDCLIALDGRTGVRKWHFQTTHHDLWDYDLPSQPTLGTITRNGQKVDVVIQASKQGFVFVFNRETGEPIWPIEERPVGQTTVPGEQTWPTQPFPTLPAPVARQKLTLEDISPLLGPAEYKSARERFALARNDGLYTPPAIESSVQEPGVNGGTLYGGGAFDAETGIYYIPSHSQPSLIKLNAVAVGGRGGGAPNPIARGRQLYQTMCMTCHGLTGRGETEVMTALLSAPASAAAAKAGGAETPNLQSVTERLDLAAFTAQLRQGKGRMAPFDTTALADADVPLVYEFLKQVKNEQPVTINPANIAAEDLRFRTGFNWFRDSDAILPAVVPPWGQLTAIDLNTGSTLWRRLLGNEEPDLAGNDFPTGNKYVKGGPAVTAGGLIFQAGAADNKLRAFDKKTGDQLWEATLPFSALNTPAVYEVNGKQYIVICAFGARRNPGVNDAVIAFALPD